MIVNCVDVVKRYVGFKPGNFESRPQDIAKEQVVEPSQLLHNFAEKIMKRLTNMTTLIPATDFISMRQRLLSFLPDWTEGKWPIMELASNYFNSSIDAPKSNSWVDESDVPPLFLELIPKFPEFHPQSHLHNREDSKCVVGKMINHLPNIILVCFGLKPIGNHFKVGVADYMKWYKLSFKHFCTLPFQTSEGYRLAFNKLMYFDKQFGMGTRENTISKEMGYLNQFSKLKVMKKVEESKELYVVALEKTTYSKEDVVSLISKIPKDKTIICISKTILDGECLFQKSFLKLFKLTGEKLKKFKHDYLKDATLKICSKMGSIRTTNISLFLSLTILIQETRDQMNDPDLTGYFFTHFVGLLVRMKNRKNRALEIQPRLSPKINSIISAMRKEASTETISQLCIEFFNTFFPDVFKWQFYDIDIKRCAILAKSFVHHNLISCHHCGYMCTTIDYCCCCKQVFFCSKECRDQGKIFHQQDCLSLRFSLYFQEKFEISLGIISPDCFKNLIQSSCEREGVNVNSVLGQICYDISEFKEAYKYFKMAAKERDDSRTFLSLSQVCMDLGKDNEAIEWIDKAIELNPHQVYLQQKDCILSKLSRTPLPKCRCGNLFEKSAFKNEEKFCSVECKKNLPRKANKTRDSLNIWDFVFSYFPKTQLPNFFKEFVDAYPNTSSDSLSLIKESYQLGVNVKLAENLNAIPLENTDFKSLMRRWKLLPEDINTVIKNLKLGDTFLATRTPRDNHYFRSYANYYTGIHTFSDDNNKIISVGVDFTMFLHCKFENTKKQLVFEACDCSAYSVAKHLVLLRMMQQSCDSKNILQVWFSSGWSKNTRRDFFNAVQHVLPQDIDERVRKILVRWDPQNFEEEYWTQEDISEMWLKHHPFTKNDMFKTLIKKRDRIDAIKYFLCGCLGAGIQFPSICMFESSHLTREYKKENIFTILPPDFDCNEPLMQAVYSYLKCGIDRLKSWIEKQLVQFNLHYGDVEKQTHFTTFQPTSIFWENICDYINPSTFIEISNKISTPSTIHHMHSKNWLKDVFGMNLMDHPPHTRNEVFRRAKKYCEDNMVNNSLYIPKLIVTHHHNIGEYYLSNSFKDQWVEFYLPNQQFTVTEKVILPFNYFHSQIITMFITFKINQN